MSSSSRPRRPRTRFGGAALRGAAALTLADPRLRGARSALARAGVAVEAQAGGLLTVDGAAVRPSDAQHARFLRLLHRLATAADAVGASALAPSVVVVDAAAAAPRDLAPATTAAMITAALHEVRDRRCEVVARPSL